MEAWASYCEATADTTVAQPKQVEHQLNNRKPIVLSLSHDLKPMNKRVEFEPVSPLSFILQ
jgi:hypothetical protein